MSKVLYAILLLVLALSPFEAGYPPLGRFFWATYTNLEVALFLLGGAYLLKLLVEPHARERLLRLPLLWPILALLAAFVLSTIFGEFKSLGPQSIYRLLMGVAVYAAAWESLQGRRRLLTALSVFVGAGLVSAVIGLLEFAPGFNIQPFLRAFKPQPTTVGGMLRLSGTFEYANGAAGYFEMALPVLVSIVMLFSSRQLITELFGEGSIPESRRRAIVAFLYVAVGIYMMALILTFSRAALVCVLIGLGVFALAAILRGRREYKDGEKAEGRRQETIASQPITDYRLPAIQNTRSSVIWRSLVITVAVMAASTIVVLATQPMFRLRLFTENDLGWYKATVTADPLPDLAARQLVTVPVTLRNDGQLPWPANTILPIHLSYHWLSATANVYLVFEGLRTALPHDIAPGETVSVLAIVQAPPQAGDYRFQWDMVHENVTWFDRKQGMTGEIRAYKIGQAQVVGSQQPPASTMPPPVDVQGMSDTSSVERMKLWRAAWAMFKAHPITGVGPDGFRNLYGKYAGATDWNKNIYTNNMYIEMFANLGIVGGLAFLWLAGLALWSAARNVLRAPTGPVWLLGLGILAALVAFFAHGMVDYFLFATPLYVIFWFLLAVSSRWHEA